MLSKLTQHQKAFLLLFAFLVFAEICGFLGYPLLHPHDLIGMGAIGIGIGNLSPSQARIIDPIVTEVVQGYQYPQLVGSALFPEVPVSTRGGQIVSFDKTAFMKFNLRRAPGAGTKRIEFGYAGLPYALLEDSVEGKVPFEIMQDAERVPGINLAAQYLKTTMQVVKKSLESDQAALALNAALYPANNTVVLSGTSKWSNAAGTPTADILDYREAIRTAIGMYPNTLLLSASAFKAARENPNVVARFQYTSHDSITAEMLANLWEVDKIVIGTDVYYDETTGAMVDVWGNNAVLAYVPPAPSSQQEPSFGYTYRMVGAPYAEEPYQDRNAKSWIYPVTYERAPVVTSIDSAFLIQTPA
ncbi:major capsid protein [Acidihalobacter prosperus]|uniref:Major capsid protein E n=1 Tax=Acidihalobacter prosperus TaxID=160660 RepID=A0A1A6C8A9_9GAMM|nr:major capsid protein [Acidihalobacter prosperus]OBS10791.1 hypothetical protein Thpro_020507 [Acidihalobacter prosperus]